MPELSPEQLAHLVALPKMIVSAMMGADNASGPMKIFRELVAGANAVQAAINEYAHSPAVVQVLENINITDDDPIISQIITPELVFTYLPAIDSILGPQARDYKIFLYELAEKVASASGSGRFGAGPKVSANEADFLDALYTQLGL